MSMDISRLAIEVTSTGIREASTALQGRNGAGGLVGAADKAEKRVTALTASLSKLTSVNSSATFAAMNAALGNMSTTMQAVIAQAKALGDALEKATGSQKSFHFHTENVTGALQRKVRVSQVALNTIKAMTTAAIAYAGVGFAQSIIKESDAWANLSARLTTATGSANNGRKALEDMYDVSQRLRVPVEANARLFARMAPAMQKMGKTGEETTKVVEGIATALQLNGASGGEAASVMLQLSQSFGSGVLNGAEFNAVAENGSKIMEALADYTGKTKGELKKMGAEGKLSVQTMNEAILAALPKWQKEFDSMPVTVEGAMQRVKNAWTKAIGEMGKDVGLNVELAKALRIIEEMMPAVAKGLAGAFVEVVKWVETNKTMLGEIWTQVKGIGKTIWEAAGFMATLGTSAATVGGEVNVIAVALKGVRYVFAAIEDIVRGIRVGVGAVGVVLGGIITLATHLVGQILGRIVQAFSGLMDSLSAAASATGQDGLAAGLASAAKGAEDISKGLLSASDKTLDYTKSLMNVTSGWVEEMVKGKFAVRDLYNEEERVTKEKERQKILGQELARRGRPLTYDSNWKLSKPITPEPKESAAERAQKAFEKSLADAQAMTKAQAELNRRMDEYGASFDKMTPSQKEVIRLREQLMLLEGNGKDITEIANTEALLAEKQRTAQLELLGARMKEVLQENQDGLDKEATSLKSLSAELVNAQAKLDNFGKAPGNERQGMVDALTKEIEALQQIPDLLAAQANPAFIAAKKERLEVMKQLLAVESEIGQKEVLAELDKMLDPSRAKNFGEALASSLGDASRAAGAVTKAIGNYNARLAVTAKWRTTLDTLNKGDVRHAQLSKVIVEQEAKDRIASYADMASAAKGFFSEGSKGYKALETAEKTFRAFEMAMAIKSFVEKSGMLAAFTSMFVASKATETTAEGQSVAANLAANLAKQASNATTALTSALAAPFPTNIAAFAMVAALLASIGVAVGGGGSSGMSAADKQAKAGTGTVFGAPDAKSESISKGISILVDNSDIALEYSSGMLRSLLNIEASLTGATNAILRSGGSITGRGFEGSSRNSSWAQAALFGGVVGILDKMLFGGTVSRLLGFGSRSELKDTGITAGNQSVGGILSGGFKGNTYSDIETTKKALFITYSKSTDRALGVLDETIATEFTNVIKSMVDGISSAAEGLGKDSNAVRAALEAMTISFGDLSFKDMSAEEIQKQLEAIFSGIGDTMAKMAFGEMLDAFQQAGEGLMETAIRVANGIDVASYELDKLGLTAINFADIINKSGDVAAEIVRQSIMVVEVGTSVGNIVNTLSGSASEIARTYSSLLTARNALQGLSIASDVSVGLIRAAGGLESLLDALESYSERYFTDQERQAMETSRLQKEFAKLGQTMPATKAGFRTMIETLSASGATGQEAAMKLLLLNEAFADLIDNADAMKQEAIDTARSNLSDAYEREADALRTTKERFEEFAKSLTEFRYSLLLGDQSTLTNAEKYATAKARYEATAAAALAGDQTAQDNFQSVAQEFLSFSRIMNASGAGYQSDFANVLAQTTALEEMAKGQATMAEKQLAALDAQVAGLLTVNESVLTVAEAIAALTALLTPATEIGNRADTLPVDGRAGAASVEGSYAMDYSQYGAANTQALVAEIQMLRTEVSSLRAEQAAQTSALIASNYDANAQNANAVVDGTKDAAEMAAYLAQSKVNILV
jgi:tape measure domain-containing protein